MRPVATQIWILTARHNVLFRRPRKWKAARGFKRNSAMKDGLPRMLRIVSLPRSARVLKRKLNVN
jgi:hypothetical protein